MTYKMWSTIFGENHFIIKESDIVGYSMDQRSMATVLPCSTMCCLSQVFYAFAAALPKNVVGRGSISFRVIRGWPADRPLSVGPLTPISHDAISLSLVQ